MKLDEGSKKRRTVSSLPPQLRKQVWDTHIGIHIKSAKCPLCNQKTISSSDLAGFECAHIIADKFMTDEDKLSPYHLYPSCSACNLEMSTLCIFDYLYGRGRYNELRKMIRSICLLYMAENQVPAEHYHVILERLYGQQDKYKAGGGICNTREIYTIAKSEQMRVMAEQIRDMSLQLYDLNMRLALLADSK